MASPQPKGIAMQRKQPHIWIRPGGTELRYAHEETEHILPAKILVEIITPPDKHGDNKSIVELSDLIKTWVAAQPS